MNRNQGRNRTSKIKKLSFKQFVAQKNEDQIEFINQIIINDLVQETFGYRCMPGKFEMIDHEYNGFYISRIITKEGTGIVAFENKNIFEKYKDHLPNYLVYAINRLDFYTPTQVVRYLMLLGLCAPGAVAGEEI